MADESKFRNAGDVIKEAGAKGFNPGLIVLLVVVGLLLAFLVGNYTLYVYAQKTLPPKKKNRLQEEDEKGKAEARRLSTRRIE